jgi:hypothetical protein
VELVCVASDVPIRFNAAASLRLCRLLLPDLLEDMIDTGMCDAFAFS